MTTYSATGPDGKTYSLEGPEGATDEQVMAELQKQYNAQQKSAPKPGIINEAKRGLKQFLNSTGAGIASFGGQQSATDAGLAANERAQQIDAEHGASPLERVKDAYNKKGFMSAAGEFVSGMPAAIAGQAPQLAAGLGGARLGSMAGSVFGPVGTVVGGALGAGASMYPGFVGENLSSQAAAAKDRGATFQADRTSANVAAAGQTALEVGGTALVLGKNLVSKVLKTVPTEAVASSARAQAQLVATAQRSLAATAARGAGHAVVVEIPVEVAQQIMERAQAGQDLMSPEALAAYGDVALGTAQASPGMGVAGHISERGHAQKQIATTKALEDAKAAEVQQAAEAAAAAQKAEDQKKPEYVADLDKRYQDFLAQKNAVATQIVAVGPKPPKGDPSAEIAYKTRIAGLEEQAKALDEANKDLIAEHASRRGDIDAIKAQQSATAGVPEQTGNTPAEDAGETAPLPAYGANSQPDLFADTQTTPATAAATPTPPVPLEQQIQEASTRLVQHTNSIDALRGLVQQAHDKDDMEAVVRHSKQANELAKQTKPLEDALKVLKSQHAPTVEADLARIKKKLADAVDAGDTTKTEKLAAQITEMQKGLQPSVTSKENVTRVAEGDAALADEIATGREQAAATSAKVDTEKQGLQRIAAKADQPSEARGILNDQAKAAQAAPAPTQDVAQAPIEGVANTADEQLNARTKDLVGRLGDTLVDEDTAEIERQIGELKREKVQHQSIGREDYAAATQARITALESRLRINPQDADAVGRVDTLYRELEKAKAAAESARASKNVPESEAAIERSRRISDQLAAAQQEPGSVTGRLVRAKNDTARGLNDFFDAAHEIHTSGMVQRLRDKQMLLHSQRRDLERNPLQRTGDVAVLAAKRAELDRQLDTIGRQLASLNGEVSPKKLAAQARGHIRKYVRAAMREENIRREARQQKPMSGAEREAFARTATQHAEAILARVMADRGGDYMEEHVVVPAQMRSGKIVKSAITEWRDNRPLEERPLAKFGAARAVEEEAFHQERQTLSKPVERKRVEGDGLKRQWKSVEEKKMSDERGDNFKTLTGQQRRRAEYLRVLLSKIDNAAVQPLYDALSKYPTNGMMDVIEPLVNNARAGVMPSALELGQVKEAVALEQNVARADDGQRSLFDPQTAQGAQGRIEDKQAALETQAEALEGKKVGSFKEAGETLKEKQRIAEQQKKLDTDLDAAKDDEAALRKEKDRMSVAHERTTPARFANSPEVKAGRAAADEQAALVADINAQLEEIVADEAKPTWAAKLARAVVELQKQIASFKQSRPFADMGRMQGRDIPPVAKGAQLGKKFTEQDSADIIFQLANYNKFVEETNAFLAKQRGTDSPEFKALITQLEITKRAIASLPTDAELVAARRMVQETATALKNLRAMPEPVKPAGRKARQENIDNAQAALDMAEAVLQLKSTTPKLTPEVEGSRAERARLAKEGADRRKTEALEAAKRTADMDAAVEERMRLDEAQQRLAKLPTTRVERDGGYTELLRTGLRREAAGLERMLELARGDGTPADHVAKLERMLKNSEQAYLQIEDRAPRKATEVKGKTDTSEADDVLQPQPVPRAKQKRIDKAVAAAEALNEKQTARGRPVVTRTIGKGQGKVSSTRAPRKEGPEQQARLDAVGEELGDNIKVREAQARLDHVEDLQELLATRRAADTSRANKKKYDAYEKKLEQEHADASAALARLQGDTEVDTDEDVNAAANVFDAANNGPYLSTEAIAAAHDGRILDVAEDLATNGSTPEIRAAAARLRPLLLRTKLIVDESIKHDGESVAGLYSPEQNRITMHPQGLTELDTVHEMTHAATDAVLLAPIDSLTPEQRKGRVGLEQMWQAASKRADLKGMHGASNVREFAAEVYSNEAFRAKLDTIGKPRTMLDYIKSFFRMLLGTPTPPSGKAKDFIEQLLSPSRKMTGVAAPNMFSTPAYSNDLASFGKDLSHNRSVVADLKATGLSKLKMALEQKLIDQRATLRKVSSIGNTLTGTQVKGDLLSADKALQNGMAVMSDGAFTLTKDAKGLFMMKAGGGPNAKAVFDHIAELPGKSAAEKLDLFQAYVTGKRAQDVGWDKLDYNDPVGMQKRYDTAIAKLDPVTKAQLERAQDAYHAFNKGLVQFLKDTNAVPDAIADAMMADRNYIPMFRNRGDSIDMVTKTGKDYVVGDIRRLPFLHALNTGDQKVMPFEESLLKNATMLTNLGVQNMTNQHIAYHMQGLGRSAAGDKKPMQIRRGKGGATDGATTLRFRTKPEDSGDDGERHIVLDTAGTAAEHIPTDLLAQAAAGSYHSVPALLSIGKFASDILRAGVTRMPTYVISQTIKDPLNAAMMGNLKADPFTATMKTLNNFQEHLRGNTPEDALLMRHGVLQSQIFSGSTSDVKKMLMQIAGKNQSQYRQALAKLDRVAMSADAATRLQGYRDVIKAGGSELEAVIHAQEMQNFSKRGSSQSVQIISQLVPFFNAQLQGLNVLFKSATGDMPANEILKTKEAFFRRALGMTAIALVAAAQLEDDPEWEKLSLYTKLANIPIGNGMHIPAPFESGFMFWSLPIAFMEALKDNFTSNDWADVRRILSNQLPGGGSIMPQAAKGAVDVVRNYNSAFGSPIESVAMQRNAVQERYAANTPEAMKLLSRHLADMGVNLSPVQIDYLANSYLGQLPHMVGMLTNSVFETKSQDKDTGEKPTGTAHDNPLLARFTRNPSESRYVNNAYATAKKALETSGTVKKMVEDGRKTEAAEYQKEQIAQYGTAQQATAFTNQMGFLTRKIASIKADAKLSADEKQSQIEAVYAKKNDMAKAWLARIEARAP